ncbi:MAG TPA: hypothetical protein P5530_03305 [Candidatus Diapherotrites archaeon]|jgi:hypothetical protein|nr:hypothetical protein [Candidatus Diapherotrites archaeon]
MTISIEHKKQIYNLLVEFGKESSKKYSHEKQYTNNKEANQFLINTPLAYLFAVILDSGMKSEKVWEIPFILKQRLGHFDITKIAGMSDEEIKIIDHKRELKNQKLIEKKKRRDCRRSF